MYYFSYGSNMSLRRLRARTPSAKCIDTGVLEEHQLVFHKSGRDNSAKCDAHHTGDSEHFVIGVLYEIHPDEKPALDKAEGLGSGYEIKEVLIKLDNGSLVEAFTYYAIHIDASLKPFDWYKEHVIVGAKENALPKDYIEAIQSIEIIQDNDTERRERELSIYL
ncbi:MAG: gamma-glutamylcyclotransferase family protein [Acidiferrobacterales bacterium]|nr:gamma-glutamylcyclotransferase family protein [Acidiferrobacterales bacterium]